jgi:clan AA aspartic protease (TIGR02281 family)
MTNNVFAVFSAAVITLAIVIGGTIGHSARPLPSAALHADDGPTRVSLKMRGHGTFLVPIKINGTFEMDAMIDSGASDVMVPGDVVYDLLVAGIVSSSDATGEATYTLADGSKRREPTFTIRSLKVGDWTVKNVRASVGAAESTPLLGQSFLRAFKSWSIDNEKHELILQYVTPSGHAARR